MTWSMQKCKEALLKGEDKEHVSNNTPRQMDLIEPQSDGCVFFFNPLLSFRAAFVKMNLVAEEERRFGFRGAYRAGA